MVLHHECYSIEKEANKCHSGRLINQDQSGRIEASYRIRQNFRVGKLSRFSRFFTQQRMFYDE